MPAEKPQHSSSQEATEAGPPRNKRQRTEDSHRPDVTAQSSDAEDSTEEGKQKKITHSYL